MYFFNHRFYEPLRYGLYVINYLVLEKNINLPLWLCGSKKLLFLLRTSFYFLEETRRIYTTVSVKQFKTQKDLMRTAVIVC